jgi:epsilon-lactone hydrolase
VTKLVPARRETEHQWPRKQQADLEGFPPTCMSWGADEMFRDPIRRFAGRLREAGVPARAHEVPGMFHVFQIAMP